MTEKELEILRDKVKHAEALFAEKEYIEQTFKKTGSVENLIGTDFYGNKRITIDGEVCRRMMREFDRIAEERLQELDRMLTEL